MTYRIIQPTVLVSLIAIVSQSSLSVAFGQLAAAPVVWGVAGDELKDPTNAALIYAKAWLLMPEGIDRAVSDAHGDRKKAWSPDEPLNASLEKAQSSIQALIRGSRLPSADFGPEYSQGAMMMLPHLTKMRSCARLLAADSRRLIGLGEIDPASERVAAIFGLSRHCSSDGTLISSLVSIAIHELACEQAEKLIATSKLTAEQRNRLLAESLKFNVNDPFGSHRAVQFERNWATSWLKDRCRGDKAGEQFATLVTSMLGESDPKLADVRSMNEQQLDAEFAKVDAAFLLILAAMQNPDGAKTLSAIDSEKAQGKYGVVAQLILPSCKNAYESIQRALARRDEIQSKLKVLVPMPADR